MDHPSLSPATKFVFFPLWVNFGGIFEGRWCIEAQGPRNVHVWALGLSCETPGASGPPGLHMTTRELQKCRFERPGALNTTKIPRKGPTREGEKNKNCGGRGKRKSEILGGPAEGGPGKSKLFVVCKSGPRFVMWRIVHTADLYSSGCSQGSSSPGSVCFSSLGLRPSSASSSTQRSRTCPIPSPTCLLCR